jgi:hypothetical protein
MSRYKIFRDGKGKVIVASSYAGKIVRGVAKCNENDTYNEDTGIALAAARCDVKIADKRIKRAQAQYDAATRAVNEAQADWEKAVQYLSNAEQEGTAARLALESMEKQICGITAE